MSQPQARTLGRAGRIAVLSAELVLAVAAVWLAFWLWPRGVVTITTVLDDGLTLLSTRYYGNWMALSIVSGTVAALLVVDATRHLLSIVDIGRLRSGSGRAPS